ncbi:hypothetical protein L1887_48867 [Cichorium endivia]|nr:hypothetical protein L1887_48867 [Cichorium endivia]
MVALQPGTLSSQTQTKPSSSDVGPLDRWRNQWRHQAVAEGTWTCNRGRLYATPRHPRPPRILRQGPVWTPSKGDQGLRLTRGSGRRCGDSRGSDRKRALSERGVPCEGSRSGMGSASCGSNHAD